MQIQLATVTQKGQVTIPLDIRKFLKLEPYSKVGFLRVNNRVTLESTPDVMDLAGFIKAPNGKNALKAREYMQTHYKRI